MSIDELLARPGLAPSLRLLVLTAVAIWRGDWQRLSQCADRARISNQPRQDFEETLLQAVLFCGFPRVVTAFEHLAETWPAPTPAASGNREAAEQRAAGEALFAGIYGRQTAAVHALLAGYHPDFHAFVLEAAYGRILTRPHLAPQQRELIAVGLLAAQGQTRQFAGHARGAQHFGADREQLREVLLTTFANAAAAGDSTAADADHWLQLVPPPARATS